MRKQVVFLTLAAMIAATLLFNYRMDSQKSDVLVQFEDFQNQYHRAYTSNEKSYRFQIFAQNLAKIEKHNADKTQTYTMGVNQFADMTSEEFIEKILMDDLREHMSPYIQRQGFVGKQAPYSIDYRDMPNVLNPIKNQGQCGSCWAFSTTGVLQSNIALAKKTLYSFSEQQLVDCCGDKGYECLGCNGAWPEWALNYVNAQGIVLENEYQYTAKKAACKETPTAKKFLNSAKPWSMLERLDYDAFKSALAASGPISICIDASNWSLYRSGVFSNCGTKTLNHAVLAVGYQSDGVWIVRNSWGASWGEQGYIKLSAGNTCGITEHAVIPNLA